MSNDRITDKIIELAQAKSLIRVEMDTDLFKTGFDSLSIMELVVAIESHFNIELPIEGLSKARLRTPKLISETVRGMLKSG